MTLQLVERRRSNVPRGCAKFRNSGFESCGPRSVLWQNPIKVPRLVAGQWREPTGRRPRKRYRRGQSSGSRRSDDSNPVTAVGAIGERYRLNSRGNLNILSEARVYAPELISHQISVDPIEEKLCPSLVSR